MAREGLRTLVVAKKSLSEEQYQDFEVEINYIICTFFYPSSFCHPVVFTKFLYIITE